MRLERPVLSRLTNISITKILPKLAVLLEINHHSFLSAAIINYKINSAHMQGYGYRVEKQATH